MTTTALLAEGKSLARHEGKVIFVEGAVPGDVIDVRLGKNKKDWAEGQAIRFHAYSKERATPFCQHFGVCGGCQWQMLPYEKQLEYKQQQVFDNLSRVLTDQRARQVIRRRGFGKFERSILHLASSERRMLHFEIHLAVTQLRITLDPVFGALYRKGANTRRLTALRQLVFSQCHAPSFDLLVQFLLVLASVRPRW